MLLHYYSSTTLYYKVLLRYYSSTTPYYKVLLHYYSVLQSTTPYCKVLLHYYPSTTLYHKVLLLLCTTNQNNQPASQPAPQFGRLAGEHGAGRPPGPHGSGRPAGWQDCRPAGDEIANKSTVLSSFWKGLPNDLPEKLLRTNYKVLHSLLLCTAKYNTVLHAQYYSVLCSTTPYYLALFRKTKY